MKNTDLVQLLRELGAIAENPRLLHAGQSRHLATRARQAADEIEGRGAAKPAPYSHLYLSAGRKCWHHDVPGGWEETHWERFDYVECAIYRKPTADLDDVDRRWLSDYGCRPEGWIEPSPVLARFGGGEVNK